MYYTASIHAYDVLDQVQVTARVRLYESTLVDGSRIEHECTTTFQGTGETDPRQWLQDVLVGLLEDL